MDGVRFDNLARGLANATSRRRLLRGLAGGVLGGVLGPLGLAGAATCREAGRLCNADADCCAGVCDVSNPDPKRRNRCACPGGTFECRGGCKTAADFQSDAANCGGCGKRCPAPANGVSVCVDGSCGLVCNAGYHQCGPRCLSNTDPATCGASCAPCPVPANGRATCDGTTCGVACDAGFHTCDGVTCVSNVDPATCGASCEPCPTPTNGQATCDGVGCGIACNTGYHTCDGMTCASNSDPATCGASCTPCPAPTDGFATCNGTSCGFACDPGFHRCASRCLANNDPDHCGEFCFPCPAPDHATATCPSGTCDFVCDAGFTRTGDSCCPTNRVCGNTCLPAPCDLGHCQECDEARGACVSLCADPQVCIPRDDAGFCCIPNDESVCFGVACGGTRINSLRPGDHLHLVPLPDVVQRLPRSAQVRLLRRAAVLRRRRRMRGAWILGHHLPGHVLLHPERAAAEPRRVLQLRSALRSPSRLLQWVLRSGDGIVRPPPLAPTRRPVERGGTSPVGSPRNDTTTCAAVDRPRDLPRRR